MARHVIEALNTMVIFLCFFVQKLHLHYYHHRLQIEVLWSFFTAKSCFMYMRTIWSGEIWISMPHVWRVEQKWWGLDHKSQLLCAVFFKIGGGE